jgi:hypothetical protein
MIALESVSANARGVASAKIIKPTNTVLCNLQILLFDLILSGRRNY